MMLLFRRLFISRKSFDKCKKRLLKMLRVRKLLTKIWFNRIKYNSNKTLRSKILSKSFDKHERMPLAKIHDDTLETKTKNGKKIQTNKNIEKKREGEKINKLVESMIKSDHFRVKDEDNEKKYRQTDRERGWIRKRGRTFTHIHTPTHIRTHDLNARSQFVHVFKRSFRAFLSVLYLYIRLVPISYS